MLTFSYYVIAVMTCFAVFGLWDHVLLQDRFGLFAEVERGLSLIGTLCLAMAGIIALVPLLAAVLEKTLCPLYRVAGLDPSMAVGALLAPDMGGFQLAESVAENPAVALWAGIVYASMMGTAVVFTVPVGLSYVPEAKLPAFSKGILCGIAVIPFGTGIGGLMLGIPIRVLLINLIPPVLFSLVLILCLALFQRQTVAAFRVFSRGITALSLTGFAISMVRELILFPVCEADILSMENIPLFRLIGNTSEGVIIAGSIGLILAGTLPFVRCLTRLLNRPLSRMEKKLHLSKAGLTGFLSTCANNLAMFASLGDMEDRAVMLNAAFTVPAAFVIGDHLAFAAANAPAAVPAMIAAKLCSGCLAVLLASFLSALES